MAGVVGTQKAAGNGRLERVALGAAALAIGVLVYLADRDPARSSLIPAVAMATDARLFGAAADWLPSFVHPFAFSLLAAAACARRGRPRYGACAFWWSVNVVFEIGQATSISQSFAEGTDQVFGPAWLTRTLSHYLLLGTFDPADVLAATAGALAAAAVLHLVHLRETTERGERIHGRLATVLAHVAIAALGILCIVGSGGGVGAVGYPSIDWGDQTPAGPYAAVSPTRPTVQAGSIVQFEATAVNATDPVSFQWSRDGVQIAGATASTYTLGGAQIGDDGAQFRVAITAQNGIAYATAVLQVSPSPPVVFEDTEFPVAHWTVVADPTPPQNGPTHSESQEVAGGRPGAYRSIANQLTAGPSGLLLHHYAAGATYDPRAEGEIYSVYLAMDCRRTSSTSGVISQGESAAWPTFEQAGRTYQPVDWNQYCRFDWSSRMASSLAADRFRVYSGPACGANERCPDFSGNGVPLRFGFVTRVQLASDSPAGTITLGVDNWSVTIWKK